MYPTYRYITILLIGILLCTFCVSSFAATTDSISHYGITWYFDQEVEYGQYINGDYWVIGPVTIIRITPASIVNEYGRFMNGSMINPLPDEPQGYDKAMYDVYGPEYDSTKNVARPNGEDLSESNPLILLPGSSLISTISHADTNRPQLSDASILTIVSEQPAANSFRPPYSGSIKTDFSANDIQWDLIPSLSGSSIEYVPLIEDLERKIERPWIDHHTSWLGRYMHPSNNMPEYGREICLLMGETALTLALDFSINEKDTMLYHFIQKGIDFYGIARNGGEWPDLGGHMVGRKLAILFAGFILNNPDMLEYADAQQHFIFSEDRQTWYVTQEDIGRELYHDDGRPREEYIQEDLGMPEWGVQHTRYPMYDGRNWDAYYRHNVSGAVVGEVLASHIYGIKELWNWPAVFDYIDRWSYFADTATDVRVSHSRFITSMWDNYRTDYPPQWPDMNTSSDIYRGNEEKNYMNQISVYIDVHSNMLHVVSEYHTNEPITFDLFDLSGRRIRTKHHHDKDISVDLGSLTRGIYIVKVSDNQNEITQKIAVY